MRDLLGPSVRLLAVACFGVGLAVGVAGVPGVRAVVNGGRSAATAPPRGVEEEVVGAMRSAEEVAWAEVASATQVATPGPGSGPQSPWLRVEQEPSWAQLGPYSLAPLGPLLTLRHYLSELQWASLQLPPGSPDPVLARFEIVDAFSVGLSVLSVTTSTARAAEQGFRVTAVLYWVSLPDTGSPHRGATTILVSGAGHLPPGAVEQSPELQAIERTMREELHRLKRLTRDPAAREGLRYVDGDFTYSDERGLERTGGMRASHREPSVRGVRIDTVEYLLVPEGVSRPTTTVARTPFGAEDRVTEVVQGTSGWRVDETATRQVSTRRAAIRDRNDVVPLYDISAQKWEGPRATSDGGAEIPAGP